MNVVGESLSIIYLLWFAYEAISMIVPAYWIGILTRLAWMFSKISMRLGFPDLPSFK